jgi:hypothetical protein
VKFFERASNRRVLDVIRGGKVGFAGPEIDYVDSVAPHLVGVGGDLHGGGDRDGGHPAGHGEVFYMHWGTHGIVCFTCGLD